MLTFVPIIHLLILSSPVVGDCYIDKISNELKFDTATQNYTLNQQNKSIHVLDLVRTQDSQWLPASIGRKISVSKYRPVIYHSVAFSKLIIFYKTTMV